MKRAETCSCSLCNKLYISLPPYSCVRQVYKLQSNLDWITWSLSEGECLLLGCTMGLYEFVSKQRIIAIIQLNTVKVTLIVNQQMHLHKITH